MKEEQLEKLRSEAEEAGRKLNRYWYALHSELRRCLFCGREFVGLKWAKWCSASCKVKAYQQRKKKGSGGAPLPQGGDASC
ncbi:MAG: hypothetical protein RMK89_10755 [Armatimonadota bacterium]|nr:hypothetical protein [Armatimonadota bacterium]MDW8143928.1 hypothetical protein [Armatimonadota bacterium]